MPAKPPRSRPKALADYLDAMSRPVFQAGMSWKVVETKWPAIREAFHGFDPQWVAGLSPQDVDHLSADPRVIRNRAKIEAIVANARTLLELEQDHRGFRRYLRSFVDYESLSKELRHQFRFLGEQGVYHFLWTVGEDVPAYAEWSASQGQTRNARGEYPK